MARILHSIAAGAAVAAFALAAPVQAQQKLKIGFITTLSGPPAIIGKHMKDSVEVALEHLGGKVGGLETEVIYGDDQFKPDVGVQLAEEMLKKHQVDFVSGIIWSNVMMAVVPVFAFYLGGMVIHVVKQYVQAGLRDQIPLYTVFTVDETTLPALREAAIGQYEARFWSPDIKIPASQRYVADFRKKFGYTPSFYGAQSYDSIMLIDSAVRATHGNLKDTHALVKAMRKADFDSIRGRFTYNVNHHPIQDFYLLQAVKSSGPDGAEMRILQKASEKHKDAYSQDCKMKW